MNDQDKIKQVMQDLALRFRDSADTLRDIARRLAAINRAQELAERRLNATAASLQQTMEQGEKSFTLREYVEFSSADEFRRFAESKPMAAEEIAKVNWDTLEKQLLGE